MGNLVRVAWCVAISAALATCVPARPSAQEAGGYGGQGAVAGRVTVEGRPTPGVRVWLVPDADDPDSRRGLNAGAVTDAEGKYRLTGVPAGTYTLTVSGAYVIRASGRAKTVTVREGQESDGTDLTLERGGVITGRVLDADGQPVIGAQVSTLTSREVGPKVRVFSTSNSAQTDDRGVYRLYGLPAGRYTVRITPRQPPGAPRAASTSPITYYPGVTDESQAAAVEVKAGDEVENADITLGRPEATFSVAGRVVDDQTGRPVAGVACDYAELGVRRPGAPSQCKTDANGEFRVERVRPGRYIMFMVADPGSDFYAEQTPFEVTSGDVQGVEVRARRGSMITGTAVVESDDPRARAGLTQLSVLAVQQSELPTGAAAKAGIAADGKFILRGVRPGKVTFTVFSYPRQDFSIMRVEQNGVEQARGIDVGGESVAGVRLILAYGKGNIRGRIRAQGGALPAGSRVFVSVAPAGSPARSVRSAQANAEGEFILTDVPAADYELTTRVIFPATPGARAPRLAPLKQAVNVRNGSETEVTVVLDLSQLK